MSAEGLKVSGYYVKENNPELSEYIPQLRDMDTTPIEKFNKEVEYKADNATGLSSGRNGM